MHANTQFSNRAMKVNHAGEQAAVSICGSYSPC
ncbi:Uncharacterised protein [Janthinobacterium lividum]|nr:Uncharacterised protein [Janthinobacterium lividum]